MKRPEWRGRRCRVVLHSGTGISHRATGGPRRHARQPRQIACGETRGDHELNRAALLATILHGFGHHSRVLDTGAAPAASSAACRRGFRPCNDQAELPPAQLSQHSRQILRDLDTQLPVVEQGSQGIGRCCLEREALEKGTRYSR